MAYDPTFEANKWFEGNKSNLRNPFDVKTQFEKFTAEHDAVEKSLKEKQDAKNQNKHDFITEVLKLLAAWNQAKDEENKKTSEENKEPAPAANKQNPLDMAREIYLTAAERARTDARLTMATAMLAEAKRGNDQVKIDYWSAYIDEIEKAIKLANSVPDTKQPEKKDNPEKPKTDAPDKDQEEGYLWWGVGIAAAGILVYYAAFA